MSDKYYYELYNELVEIVNEIRPYYSIDKIKTYSVYVWTKGDEGDPDDWGSNVFDIEADEIVYYDKEHKIAEEILPIIYKIQSKLKEIEYKKIGY